MVGTQRKGKADLPGHESIRKGFRDINITGKVLSKEKSNCKIVLIVFTQLSKEKK